MANQATSKQCSMGTLSLDIKFISPEENNGTME